MPGAASRRFSNGASISSAVSGYMVVERLGEVAAQCPVAALRVLAKMLKTEDRDWAYIGSRNGARAIAAHALATDDQVAKEAAADVVHDFVSRGELDVRDLV